MSHCPPILVLLFNRPDCARRLADALAQIQPRVLYVACDGPRANREGEAQLVDKSISVFQNLSWSPQLFFLKRGVNLGCQQAVSTALDWFFGEVEEGIILEDDCIPDPSFFGFCQRALEAYRTEPRIFAISGSNLLGSFSFSGASFGFSRYPHVWGWATWKRAWNTYDVKMSDWPEWRERGGLEKMFGTRQDSIRYWSEYFQKTYRGETNTWDFQLTFAMWKNQGVSITPRINLIRNIGFDERATHTKKDDGLSLNVGKIESDIVFPGELRTCDELDTVLERRFYRKKSFVERLRGRVERLFV